MAFLLPLDLSNLQLKVPFEPPITQVVDSQELVFWFCCGFGLSYFFLSVASIFQVLSDGVGNCSHWHPGNFSKEESILLRLIMVCLSSFVNCLFDDSNITDCSISCSSLVVQYCPNNAFTGCSNPVFQHCFYQVCDCESTTEVEMLTKVWMPVAIVCKNFTSNIFV